jgi:hypothetical protein
MLEICNCKKNDSMTYCRIGLPSMRRLAFRLKQTAQGRVNAVPMCFSMHTGTETAGAAGFGLFAPLPSISGGSYPSGSLQSRK